jgi:hypothetical protein
MQDGGTKTGRGQFLVYAECELLQYSLMLGMLRASLYAYACWEGGGGERVDQSGLGCVVVHKDGEDK